MSRHVCFSQDMIRRAGDAMRESWPCDWYGLARIALEAAILDTDTVTELVGNITTRKPATSTPSTADRTGLAS